VQAGKEVQASLEESRQFEGACAISAMIEVRDGV
jgi:hypothetical protein